MKKLLIFGLHDFAELAWYYFSVDSTYEVAGFVVTREYLPQKLEFHNLPILEFETIEKICPSEEYDFFVPMAPIKMNTIRENFYLKVKEKGYTLPSYISSKAIVFDKTNIGDNCFILEGSILQPFVKVGVNVIIWGAFIGHHSVIKSHIFIAKAKLCGHVIVENNSFIGTGANIVEKCNIGKGGFISMGSNVIMNTKMWGIYSGNPAVLQKKKSLEM